MALYTIGDLHLSFAKDKPMDIFGPNWKNHAEKLREGFSSLGEDDLTVLCGDLSWGMDLDETAPDFRFVDGLPGKKILLKGNHDYWWTTAARMNRFFAQEGFESLAILHNNCFFYGDYAICGTRGWFYEEEKADGHDCKIMRREVMRLEASLKTAGEREKLVFLHYPPIYQNYRCAEILELLEKHRVRLCCYGHIHGKGRALAFNGRYGLTQFRLVSADQLDFRPLRLPDCPDFGPDLMN